MAFKDKLNEIARKAAQDTYLTTVGIKTQQSTNPQFICKILDINGEEYTVLLPSGETQVVRAGGNRPLAVGGIVHIIGGVIF